MNNCLVVFVPGILGTELYWRGEGHYKKLVTEKVWASEVGVLLKTLRDRPDRLHVKTPLIVGNVLRKITFTSKFFSIEIPIYDSLLNFIQNDLGYQSDLKPYGYDWRLSIAENAGKLASFLRKDCSSKPVKIVAHSMGGLIVRYMLGDPQMSDVRNSVVSFTQIATPVRGSSKAYHTLRRGPSFSRLVEELLKIIGHFGDDTSLHNLITALETCSSIFELLPHETDHILITEEGDHYSTLEPKAWPDVAIQTLDNIRQLHAAVLASDFPAINSIYSGDISTENYYSIDEAFRVKGTYGYSRGDGTVIVASAALGTPIERRYVIEGRVDHVDLPNHPGVKEILRKELT